MKNRITNFSYCIVAFLMYKIHERVWRFLTSFLARIMHPNSVIKQSATLIGKKYKYQWTLTLANYFQVNGRLCQILGCPLNPTIFTHFNIFNSPPLCLCQELASFFRNFILTLNYTHLYLDKFNLDFSSQLC